MAKKVIWDGKEYPSMAAAARAEGVPYETMRTWLADDMKKKGKANE